MAIVLPLVGYFVYKVVSGGSEATSSRRLLGVVVGSYIAINAAAFLTALELGVQPHFFHSADGTPLYAPYGLDKALPAMMGGHLLVAGPIEALVTGTVFAYLRRTHPDLITAESPTKHEGKLWLLWGAMAVVAFAAPLGLLASGTAWGEWSSGELKDLGLGFIPRGLESFEGWWPAPVPDYGWSRMGAVIGYTLSAFVGVGLVASLSWIIGRKLSRKALHDGGPSPQGHPRTKGEGFLTKNISGLTRTLESILFSEDLARAPGFLQSLDVRVKVVTFLLFIVIVSLAKALPILAGVFLLILVLTLLSRVPLRFFLKRVMLFIPIFTAVIAIPALFITPGDPLVTISGNAIITEQGARTAGLLVLRVVDSLSFGVLLMLTTPWASFLVALRWLRFPALLVATLGMTYRYIFVLLHTANTMFLARRSRTVGRLSGGENRRWLARALTTTLAKSHYLSEEVYLAMLSRGYRGEVRALDKFGLRRRDLFLGSLALGLASVLFWLNSL
jgi:cobalt ECF transporter T component CbiQ